MALPPDNRSRQTSHMDQLLTNSGQLEGVAKHIVDAVLLSLETLDPEEGVTDEALTKLSSNFLAIAEAARYAAEEIQGEVGNLPARLEGIVAERTRLAKEDAAFIRALLQEHGPLTAREIFAHGFRPNDTDDERTDALRRALAVFNEFSDDEGNSQSVKRIKRRYSVGAPGVPKSDNPDPNSDDEATQPANTLEHEPPADIPAATYRAISTVLAKNPKATITRAEICAEVYNGEFTSTEAEIFVKAVDNDSRLFNIGHREYRVPGRPVEIDKSEIQRVVNRGLNRAAEEGKSQINLYELIGEEAAAGLYLTTEEQKAVAVTFSKSPKVLTVKGRIVQLGDVLDVKLRAANFSSIAPAHRR